MSNMPPCKDCPDRLVTDDFNCHTTCKKFLAYKEVQDKIKKFSTMDAIHHNVHVESCKRSHKRNHLRRKK